MAEARAAVQNRAREYETIYILRPDVPREGAERVSNRVKEVVSREGGKLTLVETWGRRQLAYRVSSYRRGVYVYLRYVGQGAVVSEIERNLRMLDDVLKYQTVKLRDEVDLDALRVAAEDIQFEALEPPEDEEEAEDESLARSLGLEEAPPESRAARDMREEADVSEEESAEADQDVSDEEEPAADSDMEDDAEEES